MLSNYTWEPDRSVVALCNQTNDNSVSLSNTHCTAVTLLSFTPSDIHVSESHPYIQAVAFQSKSNSSVWYSSRYYPSVQDSGGSLCWSHFGLHTQYMPAP